MTNIWHCLCRLCAPPIFCVRREVFEAPYNAIFVQEACWNLLIVYPPEDGNKTVLRNALILYKEDLDDRLKISVPQR